MAAVHDLVSSVAGSLDQFLVPSEELSARLRALLRALFQDGTSALPAGVDCPLSELMVAGFDKEQIWGTMAWFGRRDPVAVSWPRLCLCSANPGPTGASQRGAR